MKPKLRYLLAVLPLCAVLSGCAPAMIRSDLVRGAGISTAKVYRSNLKLYPKDRTLTYVGDLPAEGLGELKTYLKGARRRWGSCWNVWCRYYIVLVGEDGETVRLGLVWDEDTDSVQKRIEIDCTYPDPSEVPSEASHALIGSPDIELGRSLLESIRSLDSPGGKHSASRSQ